MVWKLSDLEHMDPKTQAVRIAHTVGENKRVQILDQAKKANIRVLNPGVKKEAEVTPEAVAEPAAPTEPTTEATTAEPVAAAEVTKPETEAKGPEPETEAREPEPERTKEATKKRRKSKGGKRSQK
jgi:hypothetical protein